MAVREAKKKQQHDIYITQLSKSIITDNHTTAV